MKSRVVLSIALTGLLAGCGGASIDGGSTAPASGSKSCSAAILSCVDISSLRVAKYKDDKVSAASFTFDDGYESDYKVVAPTFEKYGYRASFYLIVRNNTDKTWAIWRDISARGHEIGNHSWSHILLDNTSLTETDLEREINSSQAYIESHIGKKPLIFVFPGNHSNARAVDMVMANHIATRTTTFPVSGKYKIFNYNHTTTADSANHVLDVTVQRGGWFVAAGHGVDTGYEPINMDVLKGQLQYATDHASELWVDTYEHVAKYELELAKSSVSYNTISSSKIGISLQVDRPVAEFDFPLTVVVPIYKNTAATYTVVDDVGHDLAVMPGADGKELLIEIPPNSHAVLESHPSP